MDEKKNFLSKLGAGIFRHPGLDELLALVASRDGFVREKAVRRLGILGHASAIPHLIVCANDWVPQVRAAALDVLVKHIRKENAAAFVASLPALVHLQSCTRDNHGELLRMVQDFLLREENVAHLVAGVQGADVQVARIAARMLVNARLVNSTELVSMGLAHRDVVVRDIVIGLLRELGPEDFIVVIDRALQDRYMPVRREAFQQLLHRDPESGVRKARAFLFDNSASIREIALHRLEKVGAPVEQIYADALTGKSDRVATITCVLWGWGLLNCQSRTVEVLPMLDAKFPAVRRAALQTIARLLRNDARPHLEKALADVSPAVCKEAARLFQGLDRRPDAQQLIGIAKSSGLRHVAIACCRLACADNKWDWLKFILLVYGPADAPVSRETFSAEIDSWNWHFNSSFAQPDRDSLQEIIAALSACESKLTESQLRLMKFTLGKWSG